MDRTSASDSADVPDGAGPLVGESQQTLAVWIVGTAAAVEVGSAAVGLPGRIVPVDLVAGALDVGCSILDSILVGFDAVAVVEQMSELPQKTALLGEVVVRTMGVHRLRMLGEAVAQTLEVHLPNKALGDSVEFAVVGTAGVLVAWEVC
eukprot:scaffold3234_cov166-Amphora_coffeaeformis.AAC.8